MTRRGATTTTAAIGIAVTIIVSLVQWAIFTRIDTIQADLKQVDQRLSRIEGRLAK